MRYTEFKLTEDELFELKMSPTNLKRMAAETGAIAGIEFEMYVPNAAESDDNDYDVEPDWDMDESFPTGRGWRQEVIDFFRGGDYGSPTSVINRALDSLDEDYWSWKEENFQEWNDDNYDVFLDYLRAELPQDDGESDEDYQERILTVANETGGPEYERAMDQFREEYQGIDQFEDFLRDQDINSMVDFHNQYEIDWPYMNYPESSGGDLSIDDVASDFQSAIGRRVTTGGYHSGARSQTDNYRIEGDSSLHDPADPEDGGLEFISPPLPLDEMLSDLEKVVKWANRNGCYTNDSCGLHMNVSIPNFSREKLDYVKLAIFLGDEYILDQFGRLGNTYCASAMENIRKIAKTQPDKVQIMLQMMQNNLSAMASKIVHTGATNKYTSINTQDGYIEFRGPGNDWLGEYAADPGRINNTLLRCAVALDVATKPELHRKEYMKKLYKTLSLGQTDDTIQFFAQYVAGELPQSALKSFVRQAQLKRKAKKLAPDQDQPSNTSSRDQEWTGTWEVVSRPTDEVVYTVSGIGNAIRDAERYAQRWVEQTGFSDPIYVRPQMRPRAAGGFDRAPHTSIYQLVDNRDGRILLGGETRTFAYTVEMAGLAIRSYGVPSGDIRIIDMATNRSYNIDGSPANTSAPAAPPEQLYNVRWTDENGEHDVNRRAPNANAAMEDVRNSLESGRFRVISIEANPVGQSQSPEPARGTESLPPGNARWLILDRNDREVYSFINTTAQSDANAYARQWLTANAQDGQGPFTVVPVSR